MKKLIFTLIAVAVIASCKNKQEPVNKTVILKGAIVNYEEDSLYIENITSKFTHLQEEIQPMVLNENKEFSYQFELDNPAYFKIGRTFLYLSPGDSLVMGLDSDSRAKAFFSGKGAEANNYLRNVTYPKGGSFWNDVHQNEALNIETYKDAPNVFKEVYSNRMVKFNALKNVSEEFKRLEKARLKFDYVNSLNSIIYLYFKKIRLGELSDEEVTAKINGEINDYFVPYKAEYLDDFNDTAYLQLEVYQSLLYDLSDEKFRNKNNLPELNKELQEYYTTSNLVYEIKYKGYSNELGEKLSKAAEEITNQTYANVIQELLNEYKSITQGNPASDLMFTTLNEGTVKLSDYKGKVIVLDLWATWCVPCIQEKPHFEALEKKYHGNEEVEFISLSIDTEKVWRNYYKKHEAIGNHFQINRSQLSSYKVMAIPRFFVIDKDFNIVDVFAPLPSTGELETLINQYI